MIWDQYLAFLDSLAAMVIVSDLKVKVAESLFIEPFSRVFYRRIFSAGFMATSEQ